MTNEDNIIKWIDYLKKKKNELDEIVDLITIKIKSIEEQIKRIRKIQRMFVLWVFALGVLVFIAMVYIYIVTGG